MLYYRQVHGKQVPFSDLFEFDRHQSQHLREYAHEKDIHDFYWRAFAMLRVNRVEGDYLEFGCGSSIRSFRFAWKFSTLESRSKRMLWAFDSFEGLPAPEEDDKHDQWKAGAMAVSEEQLAAVMKHYHAKPERDYKTIKGFFSDSLAGKKPEDHGIKNIAFAHVDCDLYESTVPVLEYITPALSDGAVLSFDDWFCFNADPERGEQRAFKEWLETGSGRHLRVQPYLPFGWHGMSFTVNR